MSRFHTNRRTIIVAPLAALLLPAARLALAQNGTPAPGADVLAALDLPELLVSLDPNGLTVSPADVAAGRYRLVVSNAIPAPDLSLGPPVSGVTLVQVPAGMAMDDLLAQMGPPPGDAPASPAAEPGPPPPPPAWLYETVLTGGPYVMPDASAAAVIDLTAGEWLVLPQTTGPAPMPVGLTVSGEAPAGVPVPKPVVRVEMHDFRFTLSAPLGAGSQVIELVNLGEQPHFLSITGVPAGTTVDDMLALFGMTPDPAATPANGVTVMDLWPAMDTTLQSTGVTSWHTATLAPGAYLLACYAPDPSGVPHIMFGMAEIIDVA